MKKILNSEKLRTPGWDALIKFRKPQTEDSQLHRLTWFAQLPIFLAIAVILVIYAAIAAHSRETLDWIDQFATPAVDALNYFGLGVTQPMMVGPMPQRFYTNLVGLGVWGAIAFNARSILWVITQRQLPALPKEAERRWMSRHGCSQLQAWLMLRLICLFVIIPSALVFSISLLNGINGWWVIHVLEFTAPVATTFVFVVGPGAYVLTLVMSCLAYIVYDLKLFFRLFNRS